VFDRGNTFVLSPTDCQKLLSKLCVDLGFCLSPSEAENLVNNPPTSAVAFTNAIFVAEGLDPEMTVRDLIQKAVSENSN
jgi:hypothetical protein